VKTRGGDWDRRGAETRVDVPTVTGDAVAHYRRHADGVPALAFCCSVRHAEHVADTFRAAGYRAAAIDGQLGDSERRARIADLANGQLDVLTSCEIVSEGTDIPVVGAAILLRPTQSLGLYLQQVGRVLRPYPGKDRAVILDHVGNVFRHGMPDEERTWDLDIAPRHKRKARKGKEPAPRQVACPQCAALLLPQPVCPSCGFAFPEQRRIAFQDGELEQVDPAAVRRDMRRLRARARSLADLEQIERAAGYKPGWAWHVWQSRQAKQQPERRAA
jgi:superfamily II DNA or RNA helicase